MCLIDTNVSEEHDAITKNPFADHIPSFTSIEFNGRWSCGCGYRCGYSIENVSYFPEPPLEKHLLQNTLWPETQKLYAL